MKPYLLFEEYVKEGKPYTSNDSPEDAYRSHLATFRSMNYYVVSSKKNDDGSYEIIISSPRSKRIEIVNITKKGSGSLVTTRAPTDSEKKAKGWK